MLLKSYPYKNRLLRDLMVLYKKASAGLGTLPVIVSITESSDGNGERLPNRVEGVLHHLSLMADRKPSC